MFYAIKWNSLDLVCCLIRMARKQKRPQGDEKYCCPSGERRKASGVHGLDGIPYHSILYPNYLGNGDHDDGGEEADEDGVEGEAVQERSDPRVQACGTERE